jgi:hypothetical protein
MSSANAALSRSEKFAFARQAVLAQLHELPGIMLANFGRHVGNSALVLASDPPDSSTTRQADAFAGEIYDRELLNHCLRCWYLGDLFAQIEPHSYDPELLYAAALMHDAALTDGRRPAAGDPPCFAIHGANLAGHQLRTWGVTDGFAESVATTIALHMNVSVPTTQGMEAHLLHAATHLDVAGSRVQQIPRGLLHQLNMQYPRDGFAHLLTAAMRREARERPNSRAAVLWRLGMRIPIALNPVRKISS